MKKFVASLVAGIMLFAVCPAAFAANPEYSGKMKSQLIYGQNPTFGNNWDGKADLELRLPSRFHQPVFHQDMGHFSPVIGTTRMMSLPAPTPVLT